MFDAEASRTDAARAEAAGKLGALLLNLSAEELRQRLSVILPGADAAAAAAALQADALALWPAVQVISGEIMGDALAAYSAELNTVYVSAAAVALDAAEPGLLGQLLLEEFGHALDARFGAADSVGDEGAAFRAWVASGGSVTPAPRGYGDHGAILVDGAYIPVEFANYSKSGGYEGDTYSLALEGSGDNEVNYFYEMYTIPDQLSIRYEGKTLFNSGFVSGSSTGKLTVKRGTSNTIQLTLGTADSGTAWDYSVSTKGGSFKTSPLIIGAAASFKDDDKNDVWEYSGATIFGMEGGAASLLSLTGGAYQAQAIGTKFPASSAKITVANATVSGAIGGFSKVLFTGSFDLTYSTGVASSLNTGKFFSPGGLTADLEGFIIYPSQVRFDTTFKLPSDLGGQTVMGRTNDPSGALGSGVFVLDSTGLHLAGPGGKANLPDFKFKFFVLQASGTNQTVTYNAVTDAIRYQGTLEVAKFIKATNTAGTTLSLDLSGDNYAEVKAGVANFKGTLVIKEVEFTKFKLENLGINFDTANKLVGAGFTLKIPLGATLLDKSLTINAGFTYDPFSFNSIKVEAGGLNVPIGAVSGVMLQKLGITLDHISVNDPANFAVTGLVGFSEGPIIDLGNPLGLVNIGKVALLTVDVTGTIDSKFNLKGDVTAVLGHPQIYTEKGGPNEVNWESGTLSLAGSFSALFGIVSGSGTLKGDTSFNFSEFANVSVSFPTGADFGFGLNLLRGYSLAGGRFYFVFTNDGNYSNDFVSAWGNLGSHVYGLKLKFDGSVELLDGSNLPTVSSAAVLSADDGFDAAAVTAAAPAGSAFQVGANTPYILLAVSYTNTGAATPQVQVTRPDGVVITQANFAANNMKILPELTKAGQIVVEIDPPGSVTVGKWSIAPTSSTGLGVVTVDGIAGVESNATLALTAANTAGGVSIAYTGAVTGAPGGDVTLFYDTDGSGNDGVPIATGLALTSAGYSWAGEGLKPGTYFIYGAVVPAGSTPRFAYAPAPVVITAQSDLAVTMTGPTTLDAFSATSLTYTVRVTNTGSAARNVVVTESTYAGTFSGYTVAGGASGAVDAGTGRFSVSVGDLAAGGSRDLTITLSTTSAFRNGLFETTSANFVETAVTTSAYDPNLDNNVASLRTDWKNSTKSPQTREKVDLKVELTKPAGDTPVGGTTTFTLKVSNTGPDTATNVSLAEYVPGLQGVTARIDGGGAFSYGNASSFNVSLGAIASGASKEIVISGRALLADDIISTTEIVTPNSTDTNFSDNYLTQFRTQSAGTALVADMSLAGTASTTTPNVGDTVALTYTLANGGPNVGSGLQVTLVPGAGLQLLSGSGLQGTFNASTGIWTVGNISENVSRTLVVQAKVVAASGFGVTAEVTSQGEADPDSTPGNGVLTEDDIVVLLGGATVTPPRGGGGGGGPATPGSVALKLDTLFSNLSRINLTTADLTSPTFLNADGRSTYPNPYLAQLNAEKALAAQYDAGALSLPDMLSALYHLVDGTTSVANISYAFFTGRTPSAAGINYLINSPINTTDLNDSYYAKFSMENRYINFAVNLAKGGPGAATFAADYGSLSLEAAVTKAYGAVFGVPAPTGRVADILSATVPDGRGGVESRAQYFAEYGGDGAGGIGTKAAAIGFLLEESVKAGFGPYQQANLHFLQSLAYGQAAFNVDLLTVYGPAIQTVGTPVVDPSLPT